MINAVLLSLISMRAQVRIASFRGFVDLTLFCAAAGDLDLRISSRSRADGLPIDRPGPAGALDAASDTHSDRQTSPQPALLPARAFPQDQARFARHTWLLHDYDSPMDTMDRSDHHSRPHRPSTRGDPFNGLCDLGIGMAIRYGAWPGANRGVAPARGWRQQPKGRGGATANAPAKLTLAISSNRESRYPSLAPAVWTEQVPIHPEGTDSHRLRASRRSETLSGHRHSSRKVLRDPALRSTKSLASPLRQQCRFEDAGTRNSEDMDIRSCVFEDSTVVDAEVTVEVAPEGSRLLHTRQG